MIATQKELIHFSLSGMLTKLLSIGKCLPHHGKQTPLFSGSGLHHESPLSRWSTSEQKEIHWPIVTDMARNVRIVVPFPNKLPHLGQLYLTL